MAGSEPEYLENQNTVDTKTRIYNLRSTALGDAGWRGPNAHTLFLVDHYLTHTPWCLRTPKQ